ncbi:unnamed protein product [Cylicocyclus nassatus]|uniref:Uncharacterized protein n=1 Tax=Cylicocyclus nassatus TaxID=53992 RepID=A0AA36DQZ4_CYLNA|nr:unnamed protein product [Cylicocyclus nassatus]
MIEKMTTARIQQPSSVHCSAGVGRTVTFKSVNYERELIESEEMDSLDIFELVTSLRKQKAGMVQRITFILFQVFAHYCRERLGLPFPSPKEEALESPPMVPNHLAPPYNVVNENGDVSVDNDSDDKFESTDVPDFPHEPPVP